MPEASLPSASPDPTSGAPDTASPSGPARSATDPAQRNVLREVVAIAGLYGALFFGGIAVGMAIAVTVGGGTVGALVVGFGALPVALGLSLGAWRTLLGAWLLGKLARSALRSRGDEERFREDFVQSLGPVRERGPAALPGTWVFLPVTLAVGGLAALLMAITAEGDRLAAGTLILGACGGLGYILRRLARAGRLPIPEG